MKSKNYLAVVVTHTLVSCAPAVVTAGQDDPGYAVVSESLPRGIEVYKVYDRKENVVCYVSDGTYSGGISCLPIYGARGGGY